MGSKKKSAAIAVTAVKAVDGNTTIVNSKDLLKQQETEFEKAVSSARRKGLGAK